MADERHLTPDEARLVLIGAIAAAPPIDILKPGIWKAKVRDAIPFVAAAFDDGSDLIAAAHAVGAASVFVGHYQSYRLEETSHRLIVSIKGERGNSEVEELRTARTDGGAGKAMKARLDTLHPDDRLVIWKAIEKHRTDPNKKVRVLAHFEKLPPLNNQAQSQDRPPSEPSRPPVQAAPAEDNHHEQTHPGGDPLSDRFNELPSKIKAIAAKRLREAGITFPTPAMDDADRFIAIILEIERENGITT